MRLFLLLIIILNLQSCAAPIVGGVGAIAFSSSAQEKGLGTSINDKVVYVKLRKRLGRRQESASKTSASDCDQVLLRTPSPSPPGDGVRRGRGPRVVGGRAAPRRAHQARQDQCCPTRFRLAGGTLCALSD